MRNSQPIAPPIEKFSNVRRRTWSAVTVLAVYLLSHVAMLAEAAGEDDETPRGIFVMKPDGSEVRNVAASEAFKALGRIDSVGWPRWSHDGKQLAFDVVATESSRCLTVDVTGRNLLDLGAGAMPDWSPDDKQIVYEVPVVGGKSMWVQNADGKANNWLAAEGTAPRWSPDGSQIASLAPFQVFDLVAGKTRPVFDVNNLGEAVGCDWSPDGKQLAVVVELDKRRQLLIVSAEGATKGLVKRFRSDLHSGLSWSPDGKTLVVSLYDEKHQVYRLHSLDVEGNAPPLEIAGQQGDNREPAFSPDGTLLAFASSRQATARAAPLAPSAAQLKLIRSHDKGGTVYSLGLSPDGRLAFLGGDMAHRGMQIWNTDSDEVVGQIKVPGIFVAVAPDGVRAACAEFLGGDVQYLEFEDGSLVREFKHGAPVTSMDFSADGRRLVSAGVDKCACVFDVASGDELLRLKHAGELKQVAFSRDGKRIASTSVDNKLYLWDTTSGKLLRTIEHPAVPWSVAFSPDGRRVATGTGGTLIGKHSDMSVDRSKDNSVRQWDVETGQLVREMPGHTNVVASLAYSPDGKTIVSGSFDRTLRLWDAESGRELSKSDGEGWFTKAVFSSDGKRVLAGGGALKDVEKNRWFEYPNERVRLFEIVAGDKTEGK